jgi:hypothetical protein
MIMVQRVTAVTISAVLFLSAISYAKAQINIGGVINELARAAAEQQRRETELEAQRRAREAILLEQRRQQAEARAQQKLDRERAEAFAQAERDKKETAQRAADEARQAAQRAADEARQKEENYRRLLPAAKQLIQDASEFIKTNPPSALDLVEQVATLNSALSSNDADKIKNLMQLLVTSLRGESTYVEFEQRRGERKREEANVYLADLTKTANAQREFIKFYVTSNPTQPQTKVLLPLLKELSEASASPALDRLRAVITRVELAIRETGLSDEFLRSKNLLGANSVSTPSQSLLRRTSKNAFLIDGDGQDFVVLYNSSPKAPHVAKNLRGEIDFEKSTAKVCLYQSGFDRSQIFLLRERLQAFRLKPKDVDVDQTDCNRSELLGYDVIAMERGAFLRIPPDQALTLLAEIENDRFKQLITVSKADRDEAAQKRAAQRDTIRSDIQDSLPDNFAIVVSSKETPVLCVVASQNLRGHKNWIGEHADQLSIEANLKETATKESIDSAYKAVEKAECGAIYASNQDLNQFIGALRRDGREFELASISARNAEIEQLEKDALDRENRALIEEQNRKRAYDEERKLREMKLAEQGAQRASNEEEFREKYGKIASASSAAIAKDVRAAFDAGEDWQSTAGFKQFSKVIWAYQNLVQSHWELQSFNSQVEDYGKGQWKDRSLETSFVEVTARMRNRILGEYKDLCFVFGRMNDAEFGMLRDSVAAPCDDARQIETWKRAHSFTSLWKTQ